MQHLIDIGSLDTQQVQRIFHITDQIRRSDTPLQQILAGEFAVNLFYENSTRTRVAFEIAAKKLGVELINVQSAGSSVAKGENLTDTFHTLRAMGVRLFNIRHSSVGAAQQLTTTCPTGTHIINAGDGVHAHPTQALLDAYTLREQYGDLSDKTIVIAGDLLHSRVARSDIAILKLLGVQDLRLAAPTDLHIEPAQVLEGQSYTDFDAALQNADAVIMLRIQKERFDENESLDETTYHQQWGLNQKRLQQCKTGCKVLHPGPVNRGIEITDEVVDGPQSLVLDQVKFGVYVRMAVMLAMFKPDF